MQRVKSRGWALPLLASLWAAGACGHAVGARDGAAPTVGAVDAAAVARCEAAIVGDGAAREVTLACAPALPDRACAEALTHLTPREAIGPCGAALCPALPQPRPLVCGLDAAALTDVGAHDVFVELVARVLTPSLGRERAAALATGFGDRVLAPPERDEPAAARVNGVPIPTADLAAELRRASFLAEGADPTPTSVLARLVDRELLRQLIAREGVTLSPDEIQREYDAFVAAAPPGFVSWIAAAGRGPTDIRAMVVEKLAVERVLDARGALAVAIDAQRAYYDAHPERFAEPAQRHVHEIFVTSPRGTARAERLAAFEKIAAAHQALVSGARFADVARRFSEGRRADRGGDLGFVGAGVFPAEIAAVVFALGDGELSKPLLSDLGFHLIKVEARRAPRTIPFAEAKGWIAEYLRARAFRSERRRLIDELREQAVIELY